jgi:nicotinic acid phosphoribosyltransferase
VHRKRPLSKTLTPAEYQEGKVVWPHYYRTPVLYNFPRGSLVSEALRHSALLTDLYELTMAAAYFENGFRANASFELFVRSLPPQRGYLLAAGLDQALDFLEDVRFQPEDISFLRRHSAFAQVSDAFFDYLKTLRFTGEVWAVPEGTPIFSEEPLLRVTGPIIEAQIVETFLLSTLTFQTMIASKAARVVAAAGGRDVVEFGSRRAHGPEAGVLAARRVHRRLHRHIERECGSPLRHSHPRHPGALLCDGLQR